MHTASQRKVTAGKLYLSRKRASKERFSCEERVLLAKPKSRDKPAGQDLLSPVIYIQETFMGGVYYTV